jgi:hypothetical protein
VQEEFPRINQTLDINIHAEYQALTPTQQADFNAYRLDLPGLPNAANRRPQRSDRFEGIDEEVIQPPDGSSLPAQEPLTLQQKMMKAAARRKLANRDSNSTHLCIQAFKKKHNHNLLNKS